MDASFGARVRRERHHAGLSLETLASMSRVSRATLSKIERGERNPSLAVAAALADVLGTPVAELLGQQSGDQLRVVRGESAARIVDGDSGVVRESVLPVNDGVEIVRYTLPGHTSAGPFHPHAAGAREVFLVLSGRAEVRAGSHRVELEVDDIASLPGDLSHEIENRSDETARLVLILVRPVQQTTGG